MKIKTDILFCKQSIGIVHINKLWAQYKNVNKYFIGILVNILFTTSNLYVFKKLLII